MVNSLVPRPAGLQRALPPRRARRVARRGAAIFVVMLVIAGLSAAGMFAVRASLSSLDSAGRHRQMVQTQQVAEMGMTMAISELTRDAQRYKGQLVADYVAPSGTQRDCRAASPARKQCARIGKQQLQAANPAVPLVTTKSGSSPSGLGFGDVSANFGSEVVDLTVGPPAPGYPMSSITSSMAFYRFTVSTTGQIVPDGVGLNDAADLKFAASNVESRAHVLVGPLH